MKAKPLKLAAIGDIHTKLWIINQAKKLLPNYDKMIFLGDYVDDWDASPEASYETVKQLIDLKLQYPKKVILLAGNHCQSEGFAGSFRCSGFREETHQLVKDLYKTRDNGNAPLFQIAYSKGSYLFTHAGVTNQFWKDTQLLIKNHYPELQDLLKQKTKLPSIISNVLNYAYLQGLSDQTDRLFQTLGQAGASRGGMGTPSPIWADKTDLIANSIPKVNQVVGHTPVNTITTHIVRNGDKTSHLLYFCDTFSTYYFPYLGGTCLPIGDNTFLELTFYSNGRVKPNVLRLD